jgi:hypothetical protein
MTIPIEGQGSKPLRVVDYTGPMSGPYSTLCYQTFPESVIPIAPLFTNLDLHYMINIIARLMARQAMRVKKVLAYQGNAAEDAERIVNSIDGDSVKVDDVQAMKELEFGGASEVSYTWITFLTSKWSEQLGNANLIGGLKADAGTLGQEQMLLANASANIDDMAFQVRNLVKSVFDTWAFHIFTDPFLDITVSKRRSGLYNIPVKLTADTRQGDFFSYNFDMEPYSATSMNPQIRMQRLMQLTTGLILPTLQLSQMQGAMPDIPALVKTIARDMDISDAEIDNIYKVAARLPGNLGPYAPQKGVAGVGDQLGASTASKELNLNQYQSRTGGSEPSNPQTGYNQNSM